MIAIVQGVAPRSAKLSSVKKLIVLAAVPAVPENYFNVKVIMDELRIEAIEFTMAADIKMCKFLLHVTNLFLFYLFSVIALVGKSQGKPKYGCPFCSAHTPYKEDGELYTLGDLMDLHQVIGYGFEVAGDTIAWSQILKQKNITSD